MIGWPLGRPAARAAGLCALVAGIVLTAQGLVIPAKAAIAQVLLERAFDAARRTGHPRPPWPWADIRPAAAIEAPRLHRRAIVLDGVSGQALAFGPGRVQGSAEPGQPGLAVYAAHRDTHFAFLGALKRGDEIDVTGVNGREIRYRVTDAYVARWDASGLDLHGPGQGLALTTCWPFGAVTHGPLRYIVLAERA